MVYACCDTITWASGSVCHTTETCVRIVLNTDRTPYAVCSVRVRVGARVGPKAFSHQPDNLDKLIPLTFFSAILFRCWQRCAVGNASVKLLLAIYMCVCVCVSGQHTKKNSNNISTRETQMNEIRVCVCERIEWVRDFTQTLTHTHTRSRPSYTHSEND